MAPAGSNEELDAMAGDYKTIAEKYGKGLENQTAIITGSNTGRQLFAHESFTSEVFMIAQPTMFISANCRFGI